MSKESLSGALGTQLLDCALKANNTTMVELLKSHGTQQSQVEPPVLQPLIKEHKLPEESKAQETHKYPEKELYAAINEDNPELIAHITRHGHIDLNVPNRSGDLPLHYAIRTGRNKSIGMLLHLRAMPTFIDGKNNSAWFYAVAALPRKPHLLIMLLETPENLHRDELGNTPAHYIVQLPGPINYLKQLQNLVPAQHYMQMLTTQNNDHKSPLDLASPKARQWLQKKISPVQDHEDAHELAPSPGLPVHVKEILAQHLSSSEGKKRAKSITKRKTTIRQFR